jgi:hypothetical protein
VKVHRALAAGLLFVFTFTVAHALPDSVRAEVRDDGSVVIEGTRYTDPVPLGVALKKLKQRHVSLHVWGKPLVNFEAVGKAILLLQKAGCAEGCMKIGFITEPAPGR